MIDGKKIEEAARECRFNTIAQMHSMSFAHKATVSQEQVDLESELIEGAFQAGINWFKENLWHAVNEKPKAFVYILAETEEFHKGYKVLMFHGGDPWEKLVKYNGITRYLYIEDLMKGGE